MTTPAPETPPGDTGPSLDDFAEAVRKATLNGMKDYDRERDEWEQAVSAQEKARQESENDNAPKRSGGGIGAWLLGGGSK